MRKITSLVILIATLLSLCSCDAFKSSFRAVGLVRSNNSHSCKASFLSLEGELVFKLKKSDAGKGEISYAVKAEEGEITLYYAIGEEKAELVTVKNGESVTECGGTVEGKETVYIIIEGKEKARGKVTVELDN